MRSRKKKKKLFGKATRVLKNLVELLPEIEIEAGVYGITVRVSMVQPVPIYANKLPLHWLFEEKQTGARIMDYWPTTGKCWVKRTGEKHRVANVWEAIALAAKIKQANDW